LLPNELATIQAISQGSISLVMQPYY